MEKYVNLLKANAGNHVNEQMSGVVPGGVSKGLGDSQASREITLNYEFRQGVPVVKVEGTKVTVTVGSVEHPMLDEHYIMWIALETKQGNQRKELRPGARPVAEFRICEDDEVVAAYEYCNLHGLWKAEA